MINALPRFDSNSTRSELITPTLVLGAAWATNAVGLSLALGAFLAGMLISETEFQHHIEADIRPFRDVLLGLFFVTIGMRLDLRVLVDEAALMALLLAGLLVA